MTTPVKFDLAKLLREKGFDKEAKCYHSDGTFQDRQNLYNYNDSMFQHGEDYLISAPTIAEVVMWLYENFGTWISVNQIQQQDTFTWELVQSNLEKWHSTECSGDDFNTPTEAYEAAIEYCLTNFI